MRSLSLSALTLSSSLMMMLLLLSSKRCGASISLPEMDGDLPLYSIAGSNLDLEFMMDSEINRILSANGNMPGNPLDRLKPVTNCGRGRPYADCLAGGNKRTCAKLYRGPCK
uniref:Rapid ALkalinization Factor n=1 Tax=Salix viminalis TaxID=40686 RepID=A0A6N2N013_SALVM